MLFEESKTPLPNLDPQHVIVYMIAPVNNYFYEEM